MFFTMEYHFLGFLPEFWLIIVDSVTDNPVFDAIILHYSQQIVNMRIQMMQRGGKIYLKYIKMISKKFILS